MLREEEMKNSSCKNTAESAILEKKLAVIASTYGTGNDEMDKKKKYLIGAGAAVILLVALLIIVIMPLNQKKKYHECMQLGIHYIEELEYEQAVVAFTKAIELDPENAMAYYGVAQVCFGMADAIEGEARLTYLEKTIDAADKILSLSVKSKEYATLAAALKDKAEEEWTKVEKDADEASEPVTEEERDKKKSEKETMSAGLPVVEISDLVNEEEWTYTESGKKLSYYCLKLPRVTIRNFEETERKINHYYREIWEQAKNGKNELKEMEQDEFVIEQIETGEVSWYLDDETTYTVLCNDGKILSISRDYEGYWGGAHGGYSNILESFDVATGAKISLESISDREDEFRLFLVNWMEKEIQNSDRADMTFDGSLTTESIANYCLVKDGLEILYNAYDIAFYAAGQFDFVIPYQECFPYLNEYGKGLVEEYWCDF